MADRWVDEPVPCGDPECAAAGGMAEPESDGVLRYYACTTCGFETGYQTAGQDENACAAGVPEEVRRAVSISPDRTAPPRGGQPVFVGTIGRRPQ